MIFQTEKNLSLPPLCEGKSHGNVKLTVEKVEWCTKNLSSDNKTVKIKVFWWGEKKGYEALIDTSLRPLIKIQYQIKTSPSLFQSYLSSCEPINIELYTNSGKLIGSSKIAICQTFARNCWKRSTKITFANKHIGDITISLEVQRMTLTQSVKSFNHGRHPEKQPYLKEIRISHKKDSALPANKILKEICNEQVSVEMHTKQVMKTAFQSELVNEKSFINIKIFSIEVTNSFTPENLSGYFLKCAATSNIFWNNEEARTFSSPLTTNVSRGFQTSFKQEICQRIFTESPVNGMFLNLGFSLQSANKNSPSVFIGFSRVDLQKVVKGDGTLCKRYPIIHEKDIVGSIYIAIDLKTEKVFKKENVLEALKSPLENIFIQKLPTKSHPSSNEQHENKYNDEPTRDQEQKTPKDNGESKSVSDSSINNENFHFALDNYTKPHLSQIYKGLLVIENLRNMKTNSENEFFITYESFWNECQESTESSVDMIFNYIKEFAVNPDNFFLKKVQNSHLELKLWEKTKEEPEKFVASAMIPLHQFYIAFRDPVMINHLSTNQLPIISIDTFVNFISPLSSANICQGKVLLAIGNESQIGYLKNTRNFNNVNPPLITDPQEPPNANNIMKTRLTSFLKELSQKMPVPAKTCQSDPANPSLPQLRKTSDLLDSLQLALSQPPQQLSTPELEVDSKSSKTESDSTSSLSQEKRIKVIVSLEHAVHLPKVTRKRQNRRKNKNNANSIEHEPLAYATFDAGLDSLKLNEKSLPQRIIKSHEGFVYTTKIIKAVNPHWNESFEVDLPLDILTNPQKRFVVKIWRKCSQDCELKPAPFEDAVIGFTAVDLSVLLTGMSILSGYYNITDFSGRNNGQIMLSFKPAETLTEYQNFTQLPIPTANQLLSPLNIDVPMSDDGSLLSRTLKRKFTELDEITQRLKARLFDVTGDENYDPDDEFERDLNTSVDEDMDIDNNLTDFEWLKKDSDKFKMFQAEINPVQPSTSAEEVSIPTQRMVSGCSSVHSHIGKTQSLLQKYDLDTLINPNIFQNLLDPSIAENDSTPTLIPKTEKNSEETSVSSIISNELVETIESALQQTCISQEERKNGDGSFGK